MKSLYNIKNHLKISLSLFVLLLVIVLTNLLEKQNLHSIEESSSSIFTDRLIPATDIFFIANQLYDGRLQLQSFLLDQEGSHMQPVNLRRRNQIVDSLLVKYKKTFLVENEVVCLNGLTAKWTKYQAYEDEIHALATNHRKHDAVALFNSADRDLFESIITDLHLLARIQVSVGEDLTRTSQSNILSTKSIFTLQFGVIVIIALICNGFLFAAKTLRPPAGGFHLN